MFWKLVPDSPTQTMDLCGELRKTKHEVAMGRTWTKREWGPRTMQLREYVLRDFWANVPSTAVFSYAMTFMDKIFGWTDEDKWVGSKITACMWMYTTCVLTEGRMPISEMQEYLKRRMLSIMFCVNWVCEGAFDTHEWVSENTVDVQVEEVMGRDLDHELCITCVVQWSMLWFSASTRLNQTKEDDEIKMAKYHEVVDMAITMTLPFGDTHTRHERAC